MLFSLILSISVLFNGCENIQQNTSEGLQGKELNSDTRSILDKGNNELEADKLITKYDSADIFGSIRRSNQVYDMIPTMFMFDSLCKIECLRIIDNNYCYSVHRINEKGYCYVFFIIGNKNASLYKDNVYINHGYSTYNKFKELTVNKSVLSEAYKIDPTFFVYENEDGSKIGRTVTVEGYYVEILCGDEQGTGSDGKPSPVIKSITFTEDKELKDLYSMILPIDKV